MRLSSHLSSTDDDRQADLTGRSCYVGALATLENRGGG
jgi:hypothetical protein